MWGCGLDVRGATNLVASGLDDTWGRERNSSRSIVPEAFYILFSMLEYPLTVRRAGLTLSSFMKRLRRRSTSSRLTVVAKSATTPIHHLDAISDRGERTVGGRHNVIEELGGTHGASASPRIVNCSSVGLIGGGRLVHDGWLERETRYSDEVQWRFMQWRKKMKVTELVEHQIQGDRSSKTAQGGGRRVVIAKGPGNLISPSPALTGCGQASEPLRPCTRPKQATAG